MPRSELFIIAVIVMVFQVPITLAADEISITYRKAETRYGHGEGILISSQSAQSGTFSFNPGDSIPFAYTGAVLEGKVDNTIYLRGDEFVYSFLVPRPTGHGYYTISFDLPETSPEKIIEIRLEDGKEILRSNVDFDVQKEGDFLVLRANTDKNHLKISFITDLMYMILSSIFAAFIFSLVLLSFVIFKRRDIRANIRKYLSFVRKKSMPFLELKEVEHGFRLYFISPVKILKSIFRKENDKISLSIPNWFISIVIIVFLLVVFFNSVTAPLEKVWPKLGSLKVVFIMAAISLSFLSGLFLLSIRDEKGLIIRLAIIGAGIVGITFAYLGVIAIILSVTTAALIYFLSVLILEEEEE